MPQPNMPETIFGYDGDGGLGDRLLAAVLSGAKIATTSLVVQYLDGEPPPRAGEHRLLKDHSGQVHARLETTRVNIVPLNLVSEEVVRDEGEGFRDVHEWRAAHVRFWHEVEDQIRREAGDCDWVLRDSEPLVVQWFRVVDPDGSDEE